MRDNAARSLFPGIQLLDYRTAVEWALVRLDAGHLETTWSDALATSQGDVPPMTFSVQDGLMIERRQRVVDASPATVYGIFTGLGGQRGWPTFNWALRLSGLADTALANAWKASLPCFNFR